LPPISSANAVSFNIILSFVVLFVKFSF
jgi:hypothetical protein